MRSQMRWCVVLAVFLLLGGCIVSDELTTLTIHPDGSAELVTMRSNIRSSEPGEKGDSELADYKSNFTAQSDEEFARIRKAGGQIVAANWIRQQAPFSNYVQVFFPNASTLEQFVSENGRDDGFSFTTQFQAKASVRKLTIQVTMPVDMIGSLESSSDAKQLRQMYADGISESRIAVTGGLITSARGFTIAADKQSALLNLRDVAEILRAGQGKAELLLEWEVKP
jgi:hypothetical protein